MAGFIIVDIYPPDSAGGGPRSAERPGPVPDLPGFCPSFRMPRAVPVVPSRDVTQSPGLARTREPGVMIAAFLVLLAGYVVRMGQALLRQR